MYTVFVMEIHYSDVLSKLETGSLVRKSFTDGWLGYGGVSGTKSIMAAVTCKIWLHNQQNLVNLGKKGFETTVCSTKIQSLNIILYTFVKHGYHVCLIAAPGGESNLNTNTK